jgi:hypothetical protein
VLVGAGRSLGFGDGKAWFNCIIYGRLEGLDVNLMHGIVSFLPNVLPRWSVIMTHDIVKESPTPTQCIAKITLNHHHEGFGFGMELCLTLQPCIVLLVPNVFLCAA